MTTQAAGTVQAITEKGWQDKTFYSIRLVDDRNYYSTGTDKPECTPGQQISLLWKPNAKGYPQVLKGSVSVTGQGSVAPAGNAAPATNTSSQTSTAGGGSNSRDDYWENKDKYHKEIEVPRISLTAARTAAVSVVTAALANDALSFGSAAKGKKLDMMLEFVDQVTDRFFLEAMDAPARYKRLVAEFEGVEAATDANTVAMDQVEDF